MRAVALLLTFLTGASGLVYEVAWQKYLATLLGSHSEATAAVLGIFLGGLSVGYALFGRLSAALASHRDPVAVRRRVLLAYGAVEAGIGFYAWLFPQLFALARTASLHLPAVSESAAFALDVLLAALLIGPPAVLMGGTIPLLTQGLTRDLDDATRLHSRVYAANTAGAFAGALAAGFALVPWLGVEGTVLGVGAVNVAAGALFAALGLRARGPAPAAAAPRNAEAPPAAGLAAFAWVALLSGFALMTLQTALNRIGALALGSSPFTFSMVVATFVLCIALGSAAVSLLPRIRPAYLAASQWALVALLLLLHPHVADAPWWAHALRVGFDSTPGAFLDYHLAVFGALLAVALLPLGLSGALLPLLFHQLRRETVDLGAVAGRLYGWNTAGSVLGALVGGYALFFWLDLDGVYRVAVLATALAAAILSLRVLPGRAVPALALGLTVAGVASAPAWEPERLHSGLFRHRTRLELPYTGPDAFFARYNHDWGAYVRFHRDDPAVSVAVFQTGESHGRPHRSIVVNGKSDGHIPEDNRTQAMAAHLPCLLADRCESAFVIGYGTGMTAGELAALDSTREVVVAEISPGVIEAAPWFEELNRHALASGKTRVVIADAYRALLRSQQRFDVIVSEPSNPWVSGIEMLYSLEFLSAARARLAPGGVYAQWYHVYETDDASVELVLRTYREAFERVAVWYTGRSDLILLGFGSAEGEPDLERLAQRAAQPDHRRQLRDIGIDSLGELLAYEILPSGVLGATPLEGPVHTLLHPRLADSAARAFFRGGLASPPPTHAHEAALAGARSSLVRRQAARLDGPEREAFRRDVLLETCHFSLDLCATLFAEWQHEEPGSPGLAELLAAARASGQPGVAEALSHGVIDQLEQLFGRIDLEDVPPSYDVARDVTRAFARYYHHAAPFHAGALREPWQRCGDDPRCADARPAVWELGAVLPVSARP